MLTRPGELAGPARSPIDIFAFIEGDPDTNLEFKRLGLLPWWSHPDLRLSFFRPLSSLTHWVDYRLWPDSPWLMHAHSVLWLGLAVAAAAFLYRRFQPLPIAGLAALLFAIDDAHAMPAMWLANRNATISVFFGLLALIAHDRWRREGWKAGGFLAPAAFLLSLLGAEAGVSVAAYLIAYVLFVDRTAVVARLKSALPMLLVLGGWLTAYKAMGYGASGSGVYIDPASDTFRYLQAVLTRGPALLWGQFGLPSDLFMFLSQRWHQVLWLLALGLLIALAYFLTRYLRGSRTACFWACGMLLSILPSCSTFASDRLLFFAGIGGMALLAAFLEAVPARSSLTGQAPSVAVRVACGSLIAVHLVLAPIGLLFAPTNMADFQEIFARSASSFPGDSAVAGQRVLVVSTPTAFVSQFAPLMRTVDDGPVPSSSLVLGSSIHEIQVSRSGPQTLVLRPRGGFLLAPGRAPEVAVQMPAFDPRYIYSLFDLLFKDDPRTRPGDRIELDWLSIEILQITEDGRPHEVAFHFDLELENKVFRWIRWEDGIYVPFEPPRAGETITLPAIRLAPAG